MSSTEEIFTPSTCRNPPCVLDISVDLSGNVSWNATIRSCSDHSVFSGDKQIGLILRENALYQSGINQVNISFSGKIFSSGTVAFNSGVFLVAGYSGVPPNATATRILHISGTGVAPNATTLINTRNALNSLFGSGQVIISSFT